MASAPQFPPPFKIVIALDRSEYSEIVLEHGLDQAARHDASEIHFLTIAKRHDDVDQLRSWLTSHVKEGLSSFHGTPDSWRTHVHLRDGKPAEEIVSFAAEIKANLLVIGRYGMHRWRRSIADQVMEAAPCPTLVVGLTENFVETEKQCADCVEVRALSEGERWFCEAHSGSDRLRWSTLVPTGDPHPGGGLLI